MRSLKNGDLLRITEFLIQFTRLYFENKITIDYAHKVHDKNYDQQLLFDLAYKNDYFDSRMIKKLTFFTIREVKLVFIFQLRASAISLLNSSIRSNNTL